MSTCLLSGYIITCVYYACILSYYVNVGIDVLIILLGLHLFLSVFMSLILFKPLSLRLLSLICLFRGKERERDQERDFYRYIPTFCCIIITHFQKLYSFLKSTLIQNQILSKSRKSHFAECLISSKKKNRLNLY